MKSIKILLLALLCLINSERTRVCTQISLTALTPGMYLIKATSGSKVETKKLLVE